jgi:hypothetical protein
MAVSYTRQLQAATMHSEQIKETMQGRLQNIQDCRNMMKRNLSGMQYAQPLLQIQLKAPTKKDDDDKRMWKLRSIPMSV